MRLTKEKQRKKKRKKETERKNERLIRGKSLWGDSKREVNYFFPWDWKP